MKRIFALILALCCVTAFCGCSGKEGGQTDEEDDAGTAAGESYISIAYSNTDSFNPYTAKNSLNRDLATLLFDPLFKVDEKFNPLNVLADGGEVSGKDCRVTIKSAAFSDGAPVTAQDVVYSFNAAKRNSSKYAAQLATVTSAKAENDKTVVFSCNKTDSYILNLLTFPIIKAGSDELKNEDHVSLPPIGCGRYILNAEQTALLKNEHWYGGEIKVNEIRLVNAPDEESLSHSVEIGAVDMYYTDLSDCNILRMSGNRFNVTLNNLVYVGVNLKSNLLKNTYMRQAISAALNRERICETAYFTNAVPATGVFNPTWEPVKTIQSIQTTSNSEISIENLKKIGYNDKSSAGYFVNANGSEISVRLLVNKENSFRNNAAQLIVSQLASVGIKVILESVPYKDYLKRLEEGRFDLYLAEVNILDNMDVSELLCEGGSVAYGIKYDKDTQATDTDKTVTPVATLRQVIEGFYSGTNDVSDIAAMAISEMPIIPVCYRTGIMFCSNKVGTDVDCYSSDIFYSVDKLTIN